MKENKGTVIAGVSALELLTIVFIVLKLLKIINWSWLWVLAPCWISAAVYVLIILVAVIVYR